MKDADYIEEVSKKVWQKSSVAFLQDLLGDINHYIMGPHGYCNYGEVLLMAENRIDSILNETADELTVRTRKECHPGIEIRTMKIELPFMCYFRKFLKGLKEYISTSEKEPYYKLTLLKGKIERELDKLTKMEIKRAKCLTLKGVMKLINRENSYN